ncbi:RluA family pseudouridine synthase [Myxococcota bacterium]
MQIECLYEDDELFVLNKPSGVLVHRGWGVAETALVDFARSRTQERAAHPIQRLDRSVSGPVLFAKSAELARELSEWAQQGRCRKDYLALVRGVAPDQLDIDHPITRRAEGPRVEARTWVRRVATAATEPRHVSLVSATPLTGRLHQVRRHLKHANYPLIGDGHYGRTELNRAFRDGYQLRRLALHAYRWCVERPGAEQVIPGTHREMRGGVVPLPSDLSEPLLRMGFELDANGFPAGLWSPEAEP